MDFGKLLKPEAVKVLTSASSKKRLMQDIGELAQQAYGLPAGQVVDALMTRETLGPTGVGHGVALPHARMDGIDKVVGAFVLLDKPIDFPRSTGNRSTWPCPLRPRRCGGGASQSAGTGGPHAARHQHLHQAAVEPRPGHALHHPDRRQGR